MANENPGEAATFKNPKEINKSIKLGWHDMVNFGKHKGKSWYDLANEKQYQYIEWCLKKQMLLDHAAFHAKLALLTKGKKCIWQKSETMEDDQKIIMYSCMVNGEQYESLPVKQKICLACKEWKTLDSFKVDQVHCKKCQYKEFTQFQFSNPNGL